MDVGDTLSGMWEGDVGHSHNVGDGPCFFVSSGDGVEVEVEGGGSGRLSGVWWSTLDEGRCLGEVCSPGNGCPFPLHVLPLVQLGGKKGGTPGKIILMKSRDMACGAVSRIDPFFVVFGNSPYKVWHSKYGTCEGPKGYLPDKSCTSQAQVQWAGTLVSSSLCGNLPYKVWQFMNGPCEGPLGYLPIKSCTSQAQVQWAGTFVSSSLCGESLDGHLTDSTVGFGPGKCAIPPGAVSELPGPVSVHFSALGSGSGEGASPPGAVRELPGPMSVQFSTVGSGLGKGAIPPGAVSELPGPVGFHGSSERVRASATRLT